jgi:hypothetical protein
MFLHTLFLRVLLGLVRDLSEVPYFMLYGFLSVVPYCVD